MFPTYAATEKPQSITISLFSSWKSTHVNSCQLTPWSCPHYDAHRLSGLASSPRHRWRDLPGKPGSHVPTNCATTQGDSEKTALNQVEFNQTYDTINLYGTQYPHLWFLKYKINYPLVDVYITNCNWRITLCLMDKSTISFWAMYLPGKPGAQGRSWTHEPHQGDSKKRTAVNHGEFNQTYDVSFYYF